MTTTTSYREHIFQKNGHYVIEQRYCPSGVYISRTVKVETWQDSEGWHTRLIHIDGGSLGVLSSKDGTALLTIDDEDTECAFCGCILNDEEAPRGVCDCCY